MHESNDSFVINLSKTRTHTMKKRFLPLSVAVVASLCAASAAAQTDNSFYVTGYAGWYFGEDVTV